jgi:L-2-amino-thiazoline-4-carboxylic acid hydrolase-like protein
VPDEPIGILKQRRIEAAIVKPLVQAFEAELGREKTRAILERVIQRLARDKGRELAERAGSTSLRAFADSHGAWRMDNALEIEVLKETEEEYSYNVTRCRYAEMYRELGLADLGHALSCNRDGSLIEGFAPDVELTRTQTLMEGATHCDFRYRKRKD